jgi:hypothetical protein
MPLYFPGLSYRKRSCSCYSCCSIVCCCWFWLQMPDESLELRSPLLESSGNTEETETF